MAAGAPQPPTAQTTQQELRSNHRDAVHVDKQYIAVKKLFEFKGEAEHNLLLDLLSLCYRTCGRGFKDTNTLLSYFYVLDDGMPLAELRIKEEDLSRETVGPPTNPESSAYSQVPGSAPQEQTQNPTAPKQTPLKPLSSELTCKVCLDAAVSVTFVPCGHLVSCLTCSTGLVECPVCRAYIRGTVRTFL